jgi:DNA-directed RNA polymerase subunit D
LKVNIISLTEDTIKFLVEEINTAFANSLRRTMMSEVPTMAIEDIFYFDNSSIVQDEIIANRVGFIPLKTDLDTYILPEDCDCDAELGCPKCRAVLTLDVESTDDTRIVYSGDLIPEDPMITPANPKIPISKLAPKQAIRFEAYAQLGKGKEHAKWSPVSMCVYQNVSVVDVKSKKKAQECIEACGNEAASLNGSKLKIIDIQKFESCMICKELVDHAIILENLKEDEFLFTVESTGALSPERIVEEAVKVLRKKLSTLVDKVEKGELSDDISDFDLPEIESGRLYSLGSGDEDDEEEGEEVDYE